MPELFRSFGFIFMFFSREHEPIHVHVRGITEMQSSIGMAKVL